MARPVTTLGLADVPGLADDRLVAVHAEIHRLWDVAHSRGETKDFPWRTLHAVLRLELMKRETVGPHAVADGLDLISNASEDQFVSDLLEAMTKPIVELSAKRGVPAFRTAPLVAATDPEIDKLGAMLALFPDPKLASDLALDGWEKPDALHITIAFLGMLGEDVNEKVFADYEDAVLTVVDKIGPITGTLQGPARFTMPPGAEETNDVIVAVFDSYPVTQLRQALELELGARGLPFRTDHGFQPHLTLAYVEKGAPWPIDRIEPLSATFPTLSFVWGDNRTDYPLAGPVEGAAAIEIKVEIEDEEADMPWHVEENGGDCAGTDKPWAVIADEDGSTVACHATEQEAMDNVAALYANVPDVQAPPADPQADPVVPAATAAAEAPPTAEGGPCHGVLVLEGMRTTDGRQFDPESLSWRELPLPLMAQFQQPETGGHALSKLVGSMTRIARVGNELRYEGVWDASPDAVEAQRRAAAGMMRWVSADYESEPTDAEVLTEGACEDPMGSDCTMTMLYHKARVMGATIVAFPAFADASIVDGPAPSDFFAGAAEDETAPEGARVGETGEEMTPVEGDVLASITPIVASAYPVEPPAEWFEPPEHLREVLADGSYGFSRLTPQTIEDSGRIYGHLARFNECHTGNPEGFGQCTIAPRSRSNYAYFRTGAVKCPDGCVISTGVLTMSGMHADRLETQLQRVLAHYDNSATAVADVAVGEDAHGIWFAGALRPGVTPAQVRELRGSSLSGDWRPIGGHMELVAALAVNAPGFPVPRPLVASARIVNGEVVSLVAAGALLPRDPVRERFEALEARIGSLEAQLDAATAVVDGLRPLRIAAARARLGASNGG